MDFESVSNCQAAAKPDETNPRLILITNEQSKVLVCQNRLQMLYFISSTEDNYRFTSSMTRD